MNIYLYKDSSKRKTKIKNIVLIQAMQIWLPPIYQVYLINII